MSRNIFLSGVHGVGKGYFIQNNLAGIKGLSIISASEIIGQVHDSEDAGNKRVKDVNENQKILYTALKDFLEKNLGNVLLDGHLVILDSNDCIKRIPDYFFENGMFDTLILLQDKPTDIYKRMFSRDGFNKIDLNLIDEIQKQETMYAEELRLRGIDVCYITPMSDATSYLKFFDEKETADGVY